jgi:hypothetical protein
MGFKVHPLIGGLHCYDEACMVPICGPNITTGECQIRQFRKIWASPKAFIDRAVALSKKGGWDGVNIDFETSSGTADDATAFAGFLGKLANAVHTVGARVSVDTNWGPYLNPGTLSTANTVDTFCDMQTYGLHDTDFERDLARDSNLTTMKRYGLGVCPTCCNPCIDADVKNSSGAPQEVRWHAKNLTARFAYATEMGVREVDIWMNTALGDTCADAEGDGCWWDQIAAWLKAP